MQLSFPITHSLTLSNNLHDAPVYKFQADLIHLGSKFSPCMRLDTNVDTALALDRVEENKTACCIYNDGSGCLQSSIGKCPVRFCAQIVQSNLKCIKLHLVVNVTTLKSLRSTSPIEAPPLLLAELCAFRTLHRIRT